MDIKLNTNGIIQTGKYTGWYIRVAPYLGDPDNGYIILISEGRYDPATKKVPKDTTAYDDYAMNWMSVEAIVENFDIKWLD